MKDLETFKAKLIKEREEIAFLLETLNKEETDVLREEAYETSDWANKYELREEFHLQKEDLEKRLELIDKALKKIENNSYGFCENCGKEIEEARLEIDPAAPYCRNCASKF
ncbi:RNA polymerase-binding transcription factor DksA [bacterium HR35]|nr:RNA polymerase-binding transcription factor DksA [bacterium HR35]